MWIRVFPCGRLSFDSRRLNELFGSSCDFLHAQDLFENN